MISKRLVIAGGGAAGFFGAISAVENGFKGEVILLEKSNKLLAKVLVSGGGRCNVTHACFENELLVQNYPRGSKEIRGPFSAFNTTDICSWFESKGVQLKTETDGRIFPVTNRSDSIAGCLLEEARKNGIKIRTQCSITDFEKKEMFALHINGHAPLDCNYLLIATGGTPKKESYEWLQRNGHTIISPVPSLFTFNIPASPLQGLEGISVPESIIKIKGTSLNIAGPMLITHWGISGPGVLKLSALAARKVFEMNYVFDVFISFLPHLNETQLKEMMAAKRSAYPSKKIWSDYFLLLPQRLWQRLAALSNIDQEEVWGQLKKEKQHLLINNLIAFELHVQGKTTYKEEFVTCGGIDLGDVNMRSMESKKIPGLYFAGEVLNVDGITGGFNFQNAWTTGWIAGKSIAGNF